MEHNRTVTQRANAYRIAPTRVNGTVEVDVEGKPDFETWVAA